MGKDETYTNGSAPIPNATSLVVETYPISHLTKGEMVALRKLMGFADDWCADVVRIPRGSPKFAQLQALLVAAGIGAAFRR